MLLITKRDHGIYREQLAEEVFDQCQHAQAEACILQESLHWEPPSVKPLDDTESSAVQKKQKEIQTTMPGRTAALICAYLRRMRSY